MVFSLITSHCTYLSIWISGISIENMGTGEYKIQTLGMIYNTNTLAVFRHTHPKSTETEADDWSWHLSWLLFQHKNHSFYERQQHRENSQSGNGQVRSTNESKPSPPLPSAGGCQHKRGHTKTEKSSILAVKMSHSPWKHASTIQPWPQFERVTGNSEGRGKDGRGLL